MRIALLSVLLLLVSCATPNTVATSGVSTVGEAVLQRTAAYIVRNGPAPPGQLNAIRGDLEAFRDLVSVNPERMPLPDTEGLLEPWMDLHDAFVSADSTLTPQDIQNYLRSTALLRRLFNKARL